jgi:hypothetical protein
MEGPAWAGGLLTELTEVRACDDWWPGSVRLWEGDGGGHVACGSVVAIGCPCPLAATLVFRVTTLLG